MTKKISTLSRTRTKKPAGHRPSIGVVGQGWVGKHLADDFERRGYRVTRYALSARYRKNRDAIANCDIVFIAVPTPTTPRGFDYSVVREVLSLVGRGNIAVIKSTILPGTTNALLDQFPDRFVLHVPEFLREAHAAYDTAHPSRNVIGVPRGTGAYRRSAATVRAILPKAPTVIITGAREAEFIKYASNCFLASKVVFANVLYGAASRAGLDWGAIHDAVTADPRIGASHFSPLGKRGARGAGGHCFIKDLAAFRGWYETEGLDAPGIAVLRSIEEKNRGLLRESRKDLDLLSGVYGERSTEKRPRTPRHL